jgi:hypothetical protein
MFDGFTPQARVLWQRAEAEAQRYGHAALEPDHLLLALAKEESEGVLEILSQHRVDPYAVWQETRRALPESKSPVEAAPAAAPVMRNVLEWAHEEAERLRHGQIASEHLFLALLRLDGAAGKRLLDMGLSLDRARAIVASRPGPVDQERMIRAERRLEPLLPPRLDEPAPLAPLPSISLPNAKPSLTADVHAETEAKPIDWQLQMTQILLTTLAGLVGGYLLYQNVDGMAGVGMAAFVLSLFRNSLTGMFAGGLLGFVIADRRFPHPMYSLLWIAAGAFVGSFTGNYWRRFAPSVSKR